MFHSILLFLIYISHVFTEECDVKGVSPAIKSIFCNIENKIWYIDQSSDGFKAVGCLLGKNNEMCQKPRIVPKDGEIEVSKAPPAAKNLEYQRLATEAEKAVPQIWWRKGYRDNKLFLSDKSSQPFVFLGNRPVRTKKLRNIYQCVTRQDFIRQARNFTLAKSLPIGEVSLKHKSKSKCATLSNSIVQLFAKLWPKNMDTLGGYIQKGIDGNMQWIPLSNATYDGIESQDRKVISKFEGNVDEKSIAGLAQETVNAFLLSPVASIWTGCFKLMKSYHCRCALAAASLIHSTNLIYRLASPSSRHSYKKPSLLVEGYILASLGRHLLHGYTSISNDTRWQLKLNDFVVLQQSYLRLYIDSFGQRYTNELLKHIPISFRPFEVEQRKMKERSKSKNINNNNSNSNTNVADDIEKYSYELKAIEPWKSLLLKQKKIVLEPVYSHIRNWMFSESRNLIDFGPYRPMIASIEAKSEAIKSKRRVLVDVGANGFFASPKYLIDTYEPFLPFTDAIMIEPEEHFKASIPQNYLIDYKVQHLKIYAEVGTGSDTDMIVVLPKLVSKDDYVVLKFDVDPNRYAQGPTMEWGFMFALLKSPAVAELVDELYIELHFHFPQLQWWHYHSNWEALDAIRGLREMGVVVHAWP